jgi:UDP-glucose 4-epimerase
MRSDSANRVSSHRVLVTGGAGYIGSHAVQRLLAEGHAVVVIDNLYRGHRAPIELLRQTAGERLEFVQGDITDRALVSQTVTTHHIDTVMHFAALAYVGEAVEHPLRYYHNNVTGLISVLEACEAGRVQRLVFSSSCSTYGQPPEDLIPIPEHCPQNPVSPYGRTKLQGEHIVRDFAESMRRAGHPFAFALLRYFNVCGCDRFGVLGEDHTPETHLIPVILRTAQGQRSHISIFGTDYPTPDGTCIRDYVHVEDLVDAHVLAMDRMRPGDGMAFNVGLGRGYSVREVIEAARLVTGVNFKVVEEGRRAGDPARAFANATKIRTELGWTARHTDLAATIETAWRWFVKHPKGYNA